MIPILITGPVMEPLSLAEAKAWLKVDGTEEDELIRTLIIAARLMVEAEIGQVLIGQNWRLIGDSWPQSAEIPIRPGRVLAVGGARVFSAAGLATPIPASAFTLVEKGTGQGQCLLISNPPAPGRARAGIEIDVRLGFGEAASDVPEEIRLAIRRVLALWFENRGDGAAEEAGLPPQIRALLRPFRQMRL